MSSDPQGVQAREARVRNGLTAAVGATCGFVAWLLWPLLTGKPEPLGGGSLYLAFLVVAGFVLGLATRDAIWAGPAGLYLGQCLAATVQALPPWRTVVALPSFLPSPGLIEPLSALALKWLFLVAFSLPALLGAALPELLVWWWEGRSGGSRTR